MAKIFKFEIITPERIVFEGSVSSILIPCESGYRGILADHAPLIANTVAGKVVLKGETEEETVIDAKKNGFLEVLKNNARLFLEPF